MKKKLLSVIIMILAIASLVCALSFSASAEGASMPSVSIDKFNLVFEDNVYLKYAVSFDGIDDNEINSTNIGMLYFSQPQESYTDGNESYSSGVVGYTTIDGEKYYTFEYRHITAKQMTDYVYSVAYIDIDGERYYSAPVKYSVLEYCYSKLGKTGAASDNEDYRNLLAATLEQGAMAQKYFGYKTDRLANDEYYSLEVVGGTLEDGFTKGLYHSGETATLTVVDKSELICASWQTTGGESYDIIDKLAITDFSFNEIYEIVNYSNHTETIDEAKVASCIEIGLTEGKHCSVCNEIIIAQEVIAATGHSEVVDAAVEATCTQTGLTEGKHCSVCQAILVEQKVSPKSNHKYKNEYSFDSNYHWRKCENCESSNKATHSYDDLGICIACKQLINETKGVVYNKSADGRYAEVVGYSGNATKIRIANTYEGLPVTNIATKAFYDCEEITLVIISDNVTSIGEKAFYSCSNLASVVMPDKISSIGKEAFAFCVSLSSISLPNSLTNISEYAFNNCDALTSVVIPNGIVSISDSSFSYCDNLASVIIPNSVTNIGGSAFSYCYNLESVIMPDSIKSIGSSAFSNCTKLFNEYGNCKYIGKDDNPYFALIEPSTKNLSTYVIHNDTKIIADYAFKNCTNLSSIVIPNGITKISNGVFSQCSKLSSITVPNTVTSIEEMAFYNCDSLTSVPISSSVTIIGMQAFYSCDGLTSVSIPDNVTSIDDSAFYKCSNLSYLIIGDGVVSIGNGAFEDCSSLTSVVIGSSVINIGDEAFCWCENLTSITIYDSVTTIGENAFYDCDSLTDIYYTGAKQKWAKIQIGDYNTPLTNATIHYNYIPEE